MCRWIFYRGPRICIANVLSKPPNSLIEQGHKANFLPHLEESPFYDEEEVHQRNHRVNADGFGISWYTNHSKFPALLRCCTPAWNNSNFKEIMSVSFSETIFGHIRAADGSAICSEANCHPFRGGRFIFMHNGSVAGFQKIKRKILALLRDDVYHQVQGCTDSEHIFALFLHLIGDMNHETSPERMAFTLQETLKRILEFQYEVGITDASSLNCAVSDGKTVVATRLRTSVSQDPPSLYISSGSEFKHEVDGSFKVKRKTPTDSSMVMIASEPLTATDEDWHLIPKDHMVIVESNEDTEGPNNVKLIPLNLSPYYQLPEPMVSLTSSHRPPNCEWIPSVHDYISHMAALQFTSTPPKHPLNFPTPAKSEVPIIQRGIAKEIKNNSNFSQNSEVIENNNNSNNNDDNLKNKNSNGEDKEILHDGTTEVPPNSPHPNYINTPDSSSGISSPPSTEDELEDTIKHEEKEQHQLNENEMRMQRDMKPRLNVVHPYENPKLPDQISPPSPSNRRSLTLSKEQREAAVQIPSSVLRYPSHGDHVCCCCLTCSALMQRSGDTGEFNEKLNDTTITKLMETGGSNKNKNSNNPSRNDKKKQIANDDDPMICEIPAAKMGKRMKENSIKGSVTPIASNRYQYKPKRCNGCSRSMFSNAPPMIVPYSGFDDETEETCPRMAKKNGNKNKNKNESSAVHPPQQLNKPLIRAKL